MSRHAIFVVNASRAEAVAATKEISQILLKEGFTLSTPSDISILGITQHSAEELPKAEVVLVLGGMERSCVVLKSHVAKMCRSSASIWGTLGSWPKLKNRH